MNRPVIGLPLGDPAGVGPEIIVKSLNIAEIYELCRPVVIGDVAVLEQAMKFCGVKLAVNKIAAPAEGKYTFGSIDVIDLANVDTARLQIGKVQAMGGQAAFDYIKKTTELALAKEIDAMATTPINKESLKAAKVNYIGHTEILEDLTQTKNPLTMFQVFDLRVFFLTRHVSLRRACALITADSIYEFIQRCVKALEVLGVKNPKLAVAGLNPHSGEHGLFGDEEVREIEPAIAKAKADGINVLGPVPADSVFHFALKGKYDAVLSLYHDQGHIATKMVDFERTISITNNMPFLRTSVDHGTAFDIAGTGKVSEVSMVEAIKLAALYAPSFNRQ
ncbi:4-hydroxythreonine-4-phosphate dehydrogenase PdxA|uniref:4-hydroxythreonine-4-phosphate dehydrogenase n=1 Tax=Dendrosporobacter quercicolus TaxID=146817 RepID=A0A1G9S3F2_9FIRM|nr:4-hydroxythreonine-4-phosphate dehydrogenase PdxA [Dendrosporobacter quercicolus]NSL49479.1 4-hydroxythreonine-4-phosphate dehydrogenase PdxA [Dendrosporobacter quercicolus DSM 1736]SDM29951.1 4-hydroxythreonine-4-phosphate dehydrogenase [Dendrosporobacter quercicolus]